MAAELGQFLKLAREYAYSEIEKTGMPIKMHVDLSIKKGKQLSEKLSADPQIVEIGILMMDCLIGQSIKEGRIQGHIKMSFEKTIELLEKNNASENIKENIKHCVLEHHGTSKFYSIESLFLFFYREFYLKTTRATRWLIRLSFR